jgi:protein-S-isoprenylcysteine O-methyltransferase Ste14
MTAFDWFAGVVLWANLPVPVFWLVLHTRVEFWRRHVRAGYAAAIVAGWGSATAVAWQYGRQLLHAQAVPQPLRWAGILLILFDAWVIAHVEQQMGARRLIGQAELTRSGEMKRDGFYDRVRHPRYAAMMLSTLGACLVAARPAMWCGAGVWIAVVLLMIRAEEHELVVRFGEAYEEYRRRVPALIPRVGERAARKRPDTG